MRPRIEPLRIYLDALCQITVQCGLAEAEAPLALAAMDAKDYVHRSGRTARAARRGKRAVARAVLNKPSGRYAMYWA